MKKSIKKIIKNIKNLEVEKKSWAAYQNNRYILDMFEDDEEEKVDYGYEATIAQIKCYDSEIRRLKNILCC